MQNRCRNDIRVPGLDSGQISKSQTTANDADQQNAWNAEKEQDQRRSEVVDALEFTASTAWRSFEKVADPGTQGNHCAGRDQQKQRGTARTDRRSSLIHDKSIIQ